MSAKRRKPTSSGVEDVSRKSPQRLHKCFRTFVGILTSVKAIIEILGTLNIWALSDGPQSVWQRGSITRLMESKEIHMDWNRVEGDWKQMKGRVKEKWGKLTDDDLTTINGRPICWMTLPRP